MHVLYIPFIIPLSVCQQGADQRVGAAVGTIECPRPHRHCGIRTRNQRNENTPGDQVTRSRQQHPLSLSLSAAHWTVWEWLSWVSLGESV